MNRATDTKFNDPDFPVGETPIFHELLARGVPWPVAREAVASTSLEKDETHELRDMVPLIARVRACLTDDLLKPDQRKRERRTPSAGHCYVASEALWHLTGRELSVFRIEHEGNSHWFLANFLTKPPFIVDATADQFESPPPYFEARHAAFMTKEPSKRAVELMRRMKENA